MTARWSRSPVFVVGLLALVGGVVPIVIAAHFGVLGVPRNDDWSYLLTAFRFGDTGTFDGNGWTSMNLVGQIVLSAPVVWAFGHRIAALQVEVALLGVAGLYATYDVARQLTSQRRALFVALLVAVGPLWQMLSVSYMTDVPAYALMMLCLALGARCLGPDGFRPGFFWASLGAGLFGFAIREYALIAPIAVVLTTLWGARHRSADRRRAQLLVGLLGLVALASFGALLVVWQRTLPHFTPPDVHVPTSGSVRLARHLSRQNAVLAGFLTAPAVLLANPVRLVTAAWTRARVTTVVVVLVTGFSLGREVVRNVDSGLVLGAGDYVLPDGALGTLTLPGTRSDLFPKGLLVALAMVGVLSVTLLACAAVPPILDALARMRGGGRGPHTRPALAMLGLAAIGFAVASTAPTAFYLPVFDRYLLALIPLAAIFVLRSRGVGAGRRSSGVSRVTGSVALVALAGFGIVTASNSASFDGAKWAVARDAARTAGGASAVDGGFEWNSFHAGGLTDPASPCVALVVEPAPPAPGSPVVSVREVWGPTGAQAWIVAREEESC